MTSPADASVVLPPDSTGKALRTISVTTMIAGVETTVQMQVLAISDSAGNVIDDFIDYCWQDEMLKVAKLNGARLNRLLECFGSLAISCGDDDDED